MGLHKVHLDNLTNLYSVNLESSTFRHNLIKYLSHNPITPDMTNEDFMKYQYRAFANFGFTDESIASNPQYFHNFRELLRSHYNFVTNSKN